MRYFLDECNYDGNVIHVAGWAVPEDPDDRLIVRVIDEEGKQIPVSVKINARPDVVKAIRGIDGKSEDLGFEFTLQPEERTYVWLEMRAEKFEIDRVKKRLELHELETAWKKEHSFFGRLRKKKQQRRELKKQRKKNGRA